MKKILAILIFLTMILIMATRKHAAPESACYYWETSNPKWLIGCKGAF